METTDPTNGLPLLQCPLCRSSLNVNRYVDGLEEHCPVCGKDVRLAAFPRLYREPVDDSKPALAGDESAPCSFYPELKAEKVCDECGCLLSSRAAVRWGDQDFCLPCLHRLREEKRDVHFVARSRLHDNLALALVTWLAPFTLFTAPVALFLLVRHRGAPTSFVPRGRARWWIAMILTVGWLLAWAVVLVVWISLILEDLR